MVNGRKMTFFILSIDGGGIRGIIPSVVLVELKRRLEQRAAARPLHRYFDLIAGTSTGGIVAAAAPATRIGATATRTQRIGGR